MSSPGTRLTDGKNLVWRNRKKISQIINVYLYFTVLPLNYFMSILYRGSDSIRPTGRSSPAGRPWQAAGRPGAGAGPRSPSPGSLSSPPPSSCPGCGSSPPTGQSSPAIPKRKSNLFLEFKIILLFANFPWYVFAKHPRGIKCFEIILRQEICLWQQAFFY